MTNFEGLLKSFTTMFSPLFNSLERVFKFYYTCDSKLYCPFCGKALYEQSANWTDWFKKPVGADCNCKDWEIREENYRHYREIEDQIADLEAEKAEILKSTKLKNIQSVLPKLKEKYLTSLENFNPGFDFDLAASNYIRYSIEECLEK